MPETSSANARTARFHHPALVGTTNGQRIGPLVLLLRGSIVGFCPFDLGRIDARDDAGGFGGVQRGSGHRDVSGRDRPAPGTAALSAEGDVAVGSAVKVFPPAVMLATPSTVAVWRRLLRRCFLAVSPSSGRSCARTVAATKASAKTGLPIVRLPSLPTSKTSVKVTVAPGSACSLSTSIPHSD